jgi:Reverse transcriptase (RNA-dependent DNA polymerase)
MESQIECRWQQTTSRYRLSGYIRPRSILDFSPPDHDLSRYQRLAYTTIGLVQAFPQAPIKQEIYMDIPKDCIVDNKNNSRWALRLLKNIYGQKQAGKVWNDFLVEGLTTKLGFSQSTVDPCILWRGDIIIIIYTDDTIITGPNELSIDKAIADIASLFDITSKETVSDFLGVNIDRKSDNTFALTQPKLIATI